MSFAQEARAEYFRATALRRLTRNTLVDRGTLDRVLGDAARRGYVTALAERDPDAFAVAAPVFDRNGVIGCLAICGPASRFDRAGAKRLGEMVTAATRSISRSLGWPGHDEVAARA
jgi:DNA-binding IclR family transcriptional regulator